MFTRPIHENRSRTSELFSPSFISRITIKAYQKHDSTNRPMMSLASVYMIQQTGP